MIKNSDGLQKDGKFKKGALKCIQNEYYLFFVKSDGLGSEYITLID